MRQGQQNRRGRGRNNNNNNQNNQNRKGQNPLTRSFESNGPDMKIRGTPVHIAEKYIALARDAHSAGDPVLAENYLQHAEHYNRIILAYREQQMSQGGGDMGVARPRPAQLIDNTDGEDMDTEEGFASVDPAEMPQPSIPQIEGGQPQPQSGQQSQPQRNFGGERYDNRPHRDRQDHQQHRQHRDRNDRNDRNDRYRDRDRDRDRGDRGERFADRHTGGEGMRDREPREQRDFREPREQRGFQGERQQHNDRQQPDRGFDRGPDRNPDRSADRPERTPERAPVEAGAEPNGDGRSDQPRRRERFAGSPHEQPEFLRRPVRRPRREATAEGDAPAAPAAAGTDEPGSE